MRFVDFLRAAVLLCAGSATALAALTVLSASSANDSVLVAFIVGWWLVAAGIGTWLGRRAQTNSPIARLLASAKSSTSLPEQRPGSLLLNRMWPLLVSTLLALGLGQLEAEATSLLAILPTVAAGAWRQHRYGNVDWKAAAVVGLASVAGVQAGVLAAYWLSEEALRRLFGVLMLIVAAQIARRALRP